ncbi:xanthine dehydrogenase YagT iron-sulfur-binding subunit [Aureimonas altamirensis DSM 21988]|uniref:Xanthine dehydrogenase YagT iron-sulfur-binding subunit n=2 Tax=Aureimonas altamirensis TaxID=370622 RepID=A0ABY1IQN7_9HYPH|nr:xanthine dehydrogenase YagT iron-sulfur-binding subunit [Aureimonas altamirensis DSM 21988]
MNARTDAPVDKDVPMDPDNPRPFDPSSPLVLNRRDLMVGTATAAVAGTLATPGEAGAAANAAVSAMTDLSVTINGVSHRIALDVRSSALDMLREVFGLTGSKKGCDHGQCGACTVHVDGRRVAACLTLAAQLEGRAVTTIEGIAPGDGPLHPMQQAFIDNDALQCGYCTPGQIMAAIACVNEGNATSSERIREYMSGNICRCGAYAGIVAAIQQAAPQMQEA